jgi:hypothetical protein
MACCCSPNRTSLLTRHPPTSLPCLYCCVAVPLGGIYDKYTTSLDLMVTRAYNRLSRIRTVLTVLIAVEAGAVVVGALAYWYLLVHRAACHHMVTCTSLLSFPGATIRSLVSQPCTVRRQAGVWHDGMYVACCLRQL